MWILLLLLPPQKEILPVRGLRLWRTGSQDVPPVASQVVSQVASQVASQGA